MDTGEGEEKESDFEDGEDDGDEEVAIDFSELYEDDKVDELKDGDEVEVKIEKAPRQSTPETIFRMMVVRGLYPKTGRPENPGAWIRKRTFEKNMEAQGLDASAMTQQMDSYRQQHRNRNFGQFQNLYYEERLNTLTRVASMKRNSAGSFIGKDNSVMNNKELRDELKNAAIEEVMYMTVPSVDEIDVPEDGPVIKTPLLTENKRTRARLPDEFVSLEEMLGGDYSQMSQQALDNWFQNEYLKGQELYRGQRASIPKHWSDIRLAPDPSDPNVDVLVKAKDLTAREKKRQSKTMYKREYDMKGSASKFSRIRAFMGWNDIVEARWYKDLRRTNAEGMGTERISPEEDLNRTNSVALAMLLQSEFLLRSGNHENLGGKQGTQEEHMGVIQLQKRNVEFREDGNAYLTFLGKSGDVYANLKLAKPELVEHLRRRWNSIEAPDDRLFSHSDEYDGVYMNKLTNGWFTPHDIRTVHANRIALEWTDKMRREKTMPKTGAEFIEAAKDVGFYVAGLLNHKNQALQNAFGYYLASSTILELGSEVEDTEELLTAYEALPGTVSPSEGDYKWLASLERKRKGTGQQRKGV